MMFSESIKATLKDAASKLTGHRCRDFMARVSEDYFGGSSQNRDFFGLELRQYLTRIA